MFFFVHTAEFLKVKKEKKWYCIFIQKYKTLKNIYYILACILAFITSLLKSWELGQYFKKNQKIFCFVLISGITNLYVKHILDIKKIVML